MDWTRPSEAPPKMKLAADSVRDLADMDSGNHVASALAEE
jgi:hypothetical protein